VARNTTVERILDGALHALAQHGERKLSMSDICEHAGVSRGTLYRYFKSQEEVLEAVGHHVEQGVRDRLDAAIAKQPAPEHRLRIVLEVVVESLWLQPAAAQVLEVAPAVALRYVRETFPQFVKIIAAALRPAAQHIPAVRDKTVTTRQLAELTLRVGASTYLVPAADVRDLPRRLEQLIRVDAGESSAAKQPRSPARTRKAG
jgi:AcrR family transcriptional regulator